MIWIAVILLALFLLLAVLLWLPLELLIDTKAERFYFKWKGLCALEAIPASDDLRWRLKVFYWHWEGSVLETLRTAPSTNMQSTQPQRKETSVKPKKSLSFAKMRKMAGNLWRALDCRRFSVDLDTGDFSLNARLYPWFLLLSRPNRRVHINFSGRQDLAIQLFTRPGRLVWAVMRAFL